MALRTEELCNDSSDVNSQSSGVRDASLKCGVRFGSTRQRGALFVVTTGKSVCQNSNTLPWGTTLATSKTAAIELRGRKVVEKVCSATEQRRLSRFAMCD